MTKAKAAPSLAAITKSKEGTKNKAGTKAPASKTSGTDQIVVSSNEVENLTKAKALKMAPALIEAEGMNDFKLGGVLQRIQEEKWWEGDDYESFKDYIEKGLGLQYRKCITLVNIYQKLVAAGIKGTQVKSIGWSKLRFILDYLSEENVAEWVQRCEENNSLEIQHYVAELKSGVGSDASETGESTITKISAMTFKVHTDQRETIRTALDKMKAEVGTEYDTVALEHISMKYIEGGLGKQKKSAAAKVTLPAVKNFLQGLDAEKAGDLVISIFPELAEEEEEAEDA